ncbi:MAG: ATP-dependent acyl-CoA ligase [Desulfobacteraceae bacterium]|nr:AMP-binding protein [Desulfobacteraceae bacterium]MBC2755889.1 ATP-dependent acyl-CoA ligase [Desulfobacteraceae bacterium]
MTESKVPGHFAYELDTRAESKPDFNVVTFENGNYAEEIVTYKDIVIQGRKIAGLMQDAGIGKGDAFALLMRNHPEFLYSLYAGALLGAVMVPIDPRVKGQRLAYMLNDSKSKGIILTSEFLANVEEVLPDVPDASVLSVSYKDNMKVPVTDVYPSLNEICNAPEAPPPDNRSDEIAVPIEVIYTSGTTGDPKGVVSKGDRIALPAQLAQFVWQYTAEDKLYTGLSLTHGNAQAATMVPSLMLSIPSVISTKFTKSRIWDICRKYGCTSFSLLGGMMMGIYSEPPKPDDADNPVRLVLSAGTPKAIWETFEKRFGVMIHEWYGAVEGGFAHKAPGVGPIGSFGKPLEGLMEMKVVRKDDMECAPGETGQIIFRLVGQKMEVDYLGKKKASQEKTRGGWLRTGDMGHTDEEGWFFFDYRAGGGLRRSGDFIQPQYVESAIAVHSDITDVCVYGIPAESGAPGESDLVAAVVPMNGNAIDPKSVFAHCRQSLEGNSIPSFLQVVDEIPKTASEKNLDRVLRDEFSKDADNVFAFMDYK